MKLTFAAVCALLAAVLFLPSLASAQDHPAYLHALSDLRDARAHLERPDGGALHAEERHAVHEINDAIDIIKKAAIDDHKNPNEHVAVDPHMPWGGRLHQALELLDKAQRDVSEEEDRGRTRGLQHRALLHIDAARHHVREAIAITEHR